MAWQGRRRTLRRNTVGYCKGSDRPAAASGERDTGRRKCLGVLPLQWLLLPGRALQRAGRPWRNSDRDFYAIARSKAGGRPAAYIGGRKLGIRKPGDVDRQP